MCARCTLCILCVLSVPLYCDARWFLALWQPDRIKTMNHLIMTNWNVIRSRCVCVCVFVSLTLCVWHIAHLTFTRLVTLFMWSIVPTFLWLHCIQSSLVLGVLFLFYSIFHSFLATLLSTASLMCRRNKSTENLLKYHVNIKCILFKFDIFLSLSLLLSIYFGLVGRLLLLSTTSILRFYCCQWHRNRTNRRVLQFIVVCL